MEITFSPTGDRPRSAGLKVLHSNHVAIAGLYRKAVQVSYIPIPGDILPLQIETRSLICRSRRIT